jgi:hypothetical protein
MEAPQEKESASEIFDGICELPVASENLFPEIWKEAISAARGRSTLCSGLRPAAQQNL